ncbi:hypothetical protein [Burkholderia cepacia]|nr:hypothetical protein [Burkholderia cepacia]
MARRRRLGIVALAGAIAVSIHVLGWFVLRGASMTAGAARPKAEAAAQSVLSVALLLARPMQPPATGVAARTGQNGHVRGKGRSTKLSGAAANARMATRSRPDASGVPHAHGDAPVQDRHEDRPANASTPDVDWGRDLASIGARRASGRSVAEAAVDVSGASSGHAAPRRDTVDARLARGMSGARRIDCRNAYAGAGLLALPMLALDAVRDTGCKW